MAPSKRGLGWPWDNQEDAFSPYHSAIEKHELTWLFNWEMWKPKGLPAALDYIPQVRTAAEAPKIDQVSICIHSAQHKRERESKATPNPQQLTNRPLPPSLVP